MIVDGRKLLEGARLEFDLCIVGGGPAGLTVAYELRESGLSICVVESGPLRPEDRYERLNEAVSVDSDLAPAVDTRARALGGSAHRWDLFSGEFGSRVRLLPFSSIDFEERSWVPDSGWPFEAEELAPYERRARSIAGLPRRVDNASQVATAERPELPLDQDRVQTTIEWFGAPSRFREELPRLVGGHANTTVLTHATVVAIAAQHTSTAVSGVELRTLEGQPLSLRARRVVLAAGGIENPRLLLESQDRHPTGLGNARDLVGRYYMDHMKLNVADYVPAERQWFDRMGLYDIHRHGGALLTGKLQLSAHSQREEQVLNAAVRFEPRPGAATLAAARAVRRLLSSARHLEPSAEPFAALLASRSAMPALGRLGLELGVGQRRPIPSLTHGWSRLRKPSRHYERFLLELQLELAPDRANRISLSDRRNALGQRLPAISWRWGELELRTIDRTVEVLDRELRRAGIGGLRRWDDADRRVMTPAGDNHPTGTTRMHRDPSRGVVDENAGVHGLENLYVTGSSVFPTSGYANPTLTIVAMAARLADHLATSS